MFIDRLKTALGATDDEFAALQPKIEKVMQLNRDVNPGPGAMFRGGRRGGGTTMYRPMRPYLKTNVQKTPK